MVLKNVKLSWAFISRTDDNGNYRVTFEVTPQQAEEIDAELELICKENNKKLKDVDWQGSKRADGSSITYSAKCAKSFKNKQGETIERDLPVYDRKAKRYELVPNVANGAIANVEVSVYFAKYKQKCGAMLGLKAVQLVEFKEYSGGSPFESLESDDPAFGEDAEDSVAKHNDNLFA